MSQTCYNFEYYSLQSNNVQRNLAGTVGSVTAVSQCAFAFPYSPGRGPERPSNKAETCFIITCCLVPLLLSVQLFSSEENRASLQHQVTVHGAPGPEPFTVFAVTEQTTTKQLLDTVSSFQIKIYYTPFCFLSSKSSSSCVLHI